MKDKLVNRRLEAIINGVYTAVHNDIQMAKAGEWRSYMMGVDISEFVRLIYRHKLPSLTTEQQRTFFRTAAQRMADYE